MYKFIVVSTLTLAAMLLTGCQEDKSSYFYLMTHPDNLEQAIQHCLPTQLTASTPACQIVHHAQSDFDALNNEYHGNPEAFGMKILDAEYQCTVLKMSVSMAQQAIKALQDKKASVADKQVAETVSVEAQKAYQEQRERVRIYLAVVGMTSPE